MTVADQLRKDGATNDEILGFYREAAKKLYALVRDADAAGPFARYRTQQLNAIARIIRTLDRQAQGWIKKHIPGLMEAAQEETVEHIKSFGETEFSVRFAGVNQEAVKVLTEKAYLDFGNTIIGLKRSGERAVMDKRAIQSEIVQGLIQGASVGRTQEELLRNLREQGFTVLKAKNGFGRRFSLEDYTNLLVRTQSITAYTTSRAETMLAAGRRFAKIPKLRPDIDGPDIYNEWEDRVYVDLTKPEQLPPYHPRCRHIPQPVSFAELKANRPDLYEQAVRYFRESA